MRVLLVGDSPEFDTGYISVHAPAFDCIVVTDGAVNKLPSDTKPDIVCGDFDTLDTARAKEQFPDAEYVLLSDQHQNDLEKALILAVERGASEITMVSSFGGRFDISLANLSVMIRHHTACRLSLIHGLIEARVLSDRDDSTRAYVFEAPRGVPVSVIPLDGDAVVTLSNVKWGLTAQVLRPGSHGVSNEACGGQVAVTVHRGMVVLTHGIRFG